MIKNKDFDLILTDLFEEGYSDLQMAKKLSVSKTTIIRHREAMGLIRRKKADCQWIDSLEDIGQCLSCPKPECTNCKGTV